MQRILVATDFSTRSDRALRRGTLLAKQFGCDVTLVHVIDDDQPLRTVEAERREATALLDEVDRVWWSRPRSHLEASHMAKTRSPYALECR